MRVCDECNNDKGGGTTMFKTREGAEQEAADMQGWNNITVVVDDEPDITGVPNIYILATDPDSGRRVMFDGSDPYARFL